LFFFRISNFFQVLDLLRMLPPSAQIVSDFKVLADGKVVNWDLYLDPNNTFKLAYTLHVIECLIEAPVEGKFVRFLSSLLLVGPFPSSSHSLPLPPPSTYHPQNWKNIFRSQNIIDRLLVLVCSTDTKNRTAKKVLRHLLTVTTLLLVGEDSGPGSAGGSGKPGRGEGDGKKNYDTKQLMQIQKIIIDVLSGTVGESPFLSSFLLPFFPPSCP
jgi:hypothetical protein